MHCFLLKRGLSAISVTTLLSATVLAGCASNDNRPNRQVAVYESWNRVVYVSYAHYHCHQGRLAIRSEASAETPAGDATVTTGAELIGHHCYYADGYGRPIDATLAVESGIGGASVGSSINVGVGGGRGSVGISTRTQLP